MTVLVDFSYSAQKETDAGILKLEQSTGIYGFVIKILREGQFNGGVASVNRKIES